MKLCFIADQKSVHIKKWANYFAARGHEVHLISSTFARSKEDCKGYDPSVHLYPAVRPFKGHETASWYAGIPLWMGRTAGIIRSIRPDIVDVQYITLTGYYASVLGRRPLVLTPWGSDILIDPKVSRLHRYITGKALHKADLVIYNSEAAKAVLTGMGIPGSRMAKVRNGVDTRVFRPAEKDGALISRLGIQESSKVVISTRHLLGIYNIETLIRAAPLILKRVPETKLIIVGDGGLREELQVLSRSLGVEGSVHFIGKVSNSDMPAYLNIADVYVSVSLGDSSPVSLQEAMACGKPVVVSDLPANREFVRDGTDGVIVPAEDAVRLAEAVSRLLADPILCGKMGESCRERISKESDYYIEMEKAEMLYEKLCGRGDVRDIGVVRP